MSGERFRIWYSDGEMRFGYLHWEGSHGRNGDVAEYDREDAEAQIVVEKERGDSDLAFVMIPVNASDRESDKLIAECRRAARERQRARWAGR